MLQNQNRAPDPLREFEELESRILEDLAAVKRLKLIFLNRLDDGHGPSTSSTAVAMSRARPTGESHSAYPKAILEALSSAGHRLTLAPLRESLARRGHSPGIATVKRYLKQLMVDGRIDNNPHAEPPGYGLRCQ